MKILFNSDTSYMLILAEKIFEGKIYGLDITDANPPASALLYLPSVFLTKITGLNLEISTVLYILTLAVLSNLYFMFLLSRYSLIKTKNAPVILACLLFLSIIFPFGHFAQREHIIFILILPFLASSILFSGKNELSIVGKIISGLSLGVVIAAKPHFILIPLFITLFDFFNFKTFRTLFRFDYFISALVIIFYGIILNFYFHYYLYNFLLSSISTYALVNRSIVELLFNTEGFYYIFIISLFWFFYRKVEIIVPQKILIIASIGFYFAFLFQGKGYPYQLFPAASCLMLAFLINLPPLQQQFKTPVILTVLCGFILLFSHSSLFIVLKGLLFEIPEQVETLNRIQRKPRMACLCTSTSVAFPLARGVDATWVSAYSSAWGAQMLSPELLKDIENGHFDPDHPLMQLTLDQLDAIAKEIEHNKPDIVLMNDHPAWERFVFSEKTVSKAMENYEPVDVIGPTIIFRRKEEFSNH